MMTRLPFAAVFLSAGLLCAVPVAAQETGQESTAEAETGGERINQVIVYGDDKCEQSSANEIVVCSRLPESERYRVPEIFRGGSPTEPKNQAWVNKVVALERVGRFGTDSCSPSGLGGFTGCTQALIAGAVAERKATDKTDWQALIADERAKRLAGIDAAAAKVEAAVVAQEEAAAERKSEAAETETSSETTDPAATMPAKGDPESEPLPMPPPR